MKQPLYLSIILFATASAAMADDDASRNTFQAKYCVQCHGQTKQKGEFRFDDISAMSASDWKDVYDQLASESMPPDDQRQPSATERRAAMRWALKSAQQGAHNISTGYRRLNKREYRNTVKDLLGLNQGTFDPGKYIYADEIDEGFDTQADSLVISNELLIEYMGAAEKSLRSALFSSEKEKPKPNIVNVNLANMKGGSRRYVTFNKSQAILRVGGSAKIFDGTRNRKPYQPGRYTLTVTASAIDRNHYPIKFQPANGPLILGMGVVGNTTQSISDGSEVLQTFELQDNVEQTFQYDIWIDKDYAPFLSFVNGSGKPITQIRANIRRKKIPATAMKQPYRGPGIRVTKFRIEGPFHEQWPPESFRTTYGMETVPNFRSPAVRKQLIRRFAGQAFRRPVTEKELTAYFGYLDQQLAKNSDGREALIKTFAAMMSSIDFLYIREEQGKLGSYELANRLSYFLWSTMPDSQLFALAKSGRLNQPLVLKQQVARMLDDPRSTQFTHSFANQWLALDKLGTMPPDTKGEFRTYYRQGLEPAMLEETHQYFRHVLYKNRSVRDFIDSNYSFLNKNLADHYGVPLTDKTQTGFQRVTFPTAAKRGGLLGHGSILTLSANGVETSPVERGVWVLAELMGTPPPPPPKEVPALTPDLNGAVTVRQMLEKHRSDPACMECHRRMDPLGFALEAYDPIGRLRTKYSKKQQISTHGTYLGVDFANVTQLKRILADDLRPFTRNLTIRLAEYAKGRKLNAADYITIQQLVDRSAENDFKFKDIVLAIANSKLMTER